MNLSVFGLGYVGMVTALCHSADGHRVWGVDTDPIKISHLQDGISPIKEPGLDQLLENALKSSTLAVTSDARAAIAATETALIWRR